MIKLVDYQDFRLINPQPQSKSTSSTNFAPRCRTNLVPTLVVRLRSPTGLGMSLLSVCAHLAVKLKALTTRKATYFNTTREELERAGENLENLSELVGGGYLATIGVYHEIHCVVRLTVYQSHKILIDIRNN